MGPLSRPRRISAHDIYRIRLIAPVLEVSRYLLKSEVLGGSRRKCRERMFLWFLTWTEGGFWPFEEEFSER